MMKIGITLSALVALAGAAPTFAQNPTPLSALLAEGAEANPDILAAEHTWRAATFVKPQVTTLPDPQFTLQEFSVGSPRPFAGFSNSNFAYIGIGASQVFPYPGKLRLKGEAADHQAEVRQAGIAVVRASIANQTKADYLRLAYLQQTLTLLADSKATLTQVAESELLRYRSGAGSQPDILKAQLKKTKLIREITMHHQDMATVQADLKRLLHRPQESADIVADTITETPLKQSAAELLNLVRPGNPEVQLSTKAINNGAAELESAKRDAKPDFSLGYMYQRTGPDFPAYYMLTFSVMPPRRQRVNAEVEQAAETLKASEHEMDGQLQTQTAEVQKQYATAASTADQLTEYREGIIPQADAVFRAVLVGYQSNKQQLDAVLTSLNEIAELKREYAQTLLQHEMALARLETLTGVELR